LLKLIDVDQGLFATASELFEARHYPGVVALASNALEDQPGCVALLEIRARAHIALRRDHEAQADLRDIIRLDPQHAVAYRLLGELAARRDEYESAGIFFREALRLDPDDHEADDWLAIVDLTSRPAAAAHILPAPAAAAGRSPSRPPSRPDRFASGTESPDDEQITGAFPTAPRHLDDHEDLGVGAALDALLAEALEDPPPRMRPPTVLPRPVARPSVPERPGFGDFLVAKSQLGRR
jgi:tetratricopeptide (TPR) repeat protein